MPEDKLELEKSEARAIELNEWFTPFPGYDVLPYETPPKNDPEARVKKLIFTLANIGNFSVTLWWTPYLVDEGQEFEDFLLVLPNSEKLIKGTNLKSEQEKMETRPMTLEVAFLDKELAGQALPFLLQTELPSGNIISAELKPFDDNWENEPPNAFDRWSIGDKHMRGPVIPETANIIGKIQMRFVSKD